MTTIPKVNPPPPSSYSGANGRSPDRRGTPGGNTFYEGDGAAGKPRMPYENQMGSPSGNPANSTEGKGEGARGELNGTNRGSAPGAGGASNKGVSG